MNNSPDTKVPGANHYESLEMDLIKQSLSKAAHSKNAVSDQPASVREFNAELLQKIGEFRQKNLELASSENTLRIALAAQEKLQVDLERRLAEKYQKEIESLQRSLNESQLKTEHSVEEWNRKFSKLSDEKWAIELELDSQKRAAQETETTVSHMQNELNAGLERERAQRAENENLRKELESLKAQHAHVLKSEKELEEAVEFGKQALQEAVETSRVRDSQMINAYEALRTEYQNMDKCYREANESVRQLRQEILDLKRGHANETTALQDRLKSEFVMQSDSLFAENAKLRENLAVRDTRNDADRAALQTLREQLNYLDQHLRQATEKMKRDKIELTNATKLLSSEIEFSLAHPFTEYLEIADLEIAQLDKQFQATSNISPARAKLQTRLEQAKLHREGIIGILSKSDSDLGQQAQRVSALLAAFETP